MLYTMWLILAVTVLVFLVIRDHPAEKNLKPWGVEHKDGEQEEKPDAASLPGAEFKKGAALAQAVLRLPVDIHHRPYRISCSVCSACAFEQSGA